MDAIPISEDFRDRTAALLKAPAVKLEKRAGTRGRVILSAGLLAACVALFFTFMSESERNKIDYGFSENNAVSGEAADSGPDGGSGGNGGVNRDGGFNRDGGLNRDGELNDYGGGNEPFLPVLDSGIEMTLDLEEEKEAFDDLLGGGAEAEVAGNGAPEPAEAEASSGGAEASGGERNNKGDEAAVALAIDTAKNDRDSLRQIDFLSAELFITSYVEIENSEINQKILAGYQAEELAGVIASCLENPDALINAAPASLLVEPVFRFNLKVIETTAGETLFDISLAAGHSLYLLNRQSGAYTEYSLSDGGYSLLENSLISIFGG
jgi:hypothetical protein